MNTQKILKKIVLTVSLVIFFTLLLIFLIFSLPGDIGKNMAIIFSIFLGGALIALFIWLILHRNWLAIGGIVYLTLVWVAVPMYLLWSKYESGIMMERIKAIVFSKSGIYEIITSLPLIFLFKFANSNKDNVDRNN